MTKHLNITVSDWVLSEIIGKVKNKSERAEELIIRGYIEEQKNKKGD